MLMYSRWILQICSVNEVKVIAAGFVLSREDKPWLIPLRAEMSSKEPVAVDRIDCLGLTSRRQSPVAVSL